MCMIVDGYLYKNYNIGGLFLRRRKNGKLSIFVAVSMAIKKIVLSLYDIQQTKKDILLIL